MRKILVLLFSALASVQCFAVTPLGYAPRVSAAYCLYNGGWIAMASSASTSSINYTPDPIALYAQNGSSWYPVSCDASGNLVSSGLSTPTAIFYLDGNRTDSYTENGSIQFPFKTLSSMASGVSGVTGSFAVVSAPKPTAYTYTGNVSFPAQQMTIIGNGSVWSVAGNITLNSNFYIQNLYTTATGTLTYASTSASESFRFGGSLTVAGGIFTSGYEHFFDMSILSNTLVTLNAGATPVFINVVGTPLFKSASGATASTVLTIIDSQSLASGAYTNVDMSNGGLAVIKGFAATNNGSVANINLAGSSAAGATTPNILTNIQAAWVAGGSSFTRVAPDSYMPLLSGTNLQFSGPMQVAQYSLTGLSASQSSTTLYTAPVAGIYRVSISATDTTVGSAGTVIATTSGAVTPTVSLAGSGNSTAGVTNLVYRTATQTITYTTTVTGNTGGVYRVDATVERVM